MSAFQVHWFERLWRAPAGALVLLAMLTPIYVGGLGWAPVAMVSDEANFGSQAASLSATGRDLNGTPLPLFFLIYDPLTPDNGSNIWYQPFLFYAITAVVSVLPIAEWSIRLPNGVMALADIWLVYLIGCRLLGRRLHALAAAAMLGLTPAHVIMSRRALDYVCPLPFALLWFWCVIQYLNTRRLGYMAVAGLALGVGLYSYIAAWALMPFLLCLTPLAVADTGRARRATATAMAGFITPLLLLLPWLLWHPETLQTLVRYQLPAGEPAGWMESVGSLKIADRISLYWDYFSPSFLFFSGGTNLIEAGIGVFPVAMAVFLAAGVYQLSRRHRPIDLVLLAVVLFAPVPIAITLPDTPAHTIARALIALPFAALIAAHGVEQLMSARATMVRAVTMLLLAAIPLQSGFFVKDYFTDYQRRTARLSDPLNTAAVAMYLLREDGRRSIPAIYFPSNAKGAAWMWRFLTLKFDRADLWARTKEFNPNIFAPEAMPEGSLLVVLDRDPAAAALLRRGGYSVASRIAGVDGNGAAVVLRKQP